VRFEPGDVFTEHYWRDRWYSVKEVRAPDGALKGWYCDVARPARTLPGSLVSEDLDLDLWVDADAHAILRLDEEEFAASDIERSDPIAASNARRALEELAGMAVDRFQAILADSARQSPLGLRGGEA
jgi:predicted RNA-binding protein associated with RNAse of E/G family